ncbi:hypothetical protein RclHR1_05650010 [Rhizophagus clarus]|uniref:Uncharacterized protein n=1 Tax=Rhizophagus clarus TaxID=94130 RepID=A0A2Z6S6R5_9GLOM|nr:hypothetical protein RclHR1_05650010 [Rhizophagus clarus]
MPPLATSSSVLRSDAYISLLRSLMESAYNRHFNLVYSKIEIVDQYCRNKRIVSLGPPFDSSKNLVKTSDTGHNGHMPVGIRDASWTPACRDQDFKSASLEASTKHLTQDVMATRQ